MSSAEEITAKLFRYPLDLTGVSPDNFVEAEVLDLPNKRNRAVVLSNGPFFTESIAVFDNTTGQPLTKKVQFTVAQLVEPATVRAGKEICSVLIITDPAVSSKIRVNYQCVGGPYILSIDALANMLETINIDDRPIIWGEIIGKPDLFPPGHHLHDAGDVFGFEYMVLALEEIRKAILMGDVASHDEIDAHINDVDDRLAKLIKDLSDAFTLHVNDKDNPHEVDKADVGLDKVENYPVASQTEAEAGTATDRYMTPQRVKQAISKQIGTSLSDHLKDFNNPHKVDKDDVALGNVYNYTIATEQDAVSAIQNFSDIFDTWYRFSHAGAVQPAYPDELNTWSYDYITDSITSTVNSNSNIGFVSPTEYDAFDFQAELSSTDPDDDRIGIVLGFETIAGVEYTLTAYRVMGVANTFQIGYNVGLAGTRTVAQNTAGIDYLNYVNPSKTGWQGVKFGIKAVREGDIITVWTTAPNDSAYLDQYKLVVDLNSSADLAKFKGSSKIGFYCDSQRNSTWEFITTPWSRNDRYMTPYTVRAAVVAAVQRDIGNHIKDKNNPHGTTKAQVGLSDVDNYGTADDATAKAGTATNKFITPAGVSAFVANGVAKALTTHVNATGNVHGLKASDISVYTQLETNNLLDKKLNTVDQAADSKLLGGDSKTTILQAAYNQMPNMGKRTLFVSVNDPTAGEGAEGDVWFKV